MTTTIQIATHGSLDDLLFRGKNKSYGAYQLRKEYEHRLRRAFIIFFTSISSIIVLVPIYQNIMGNFIHLNTGSPPEGTFYDPTEFTDIKPDLPKVEPDLPSTPTQDVQSYLDVPPAIVTDHTPDDQMTNDDKRSLDGIAAATFNDGAVDAVPSSDPVTVGNSQDGDILGSDYDPNKIYDFVTDEPEFPGDIGRYITNRCQFLDYEKELGITSVKLIVGFVVNEDGSVSHVEMISSDRESFNAQVLRAIKTMPKWKPGSNNGHKVKVSVQIPVNFTLSD